MNRLTSRAGWLSLALLATVIGCRSVPVDQAAPVVTMLGADPVQASTLQAGRSIYTHECAFCHAPKQVAAYSVDRWTNKILPRMTRWARLSPEQTQTLTSYILAAHQSASPEPTPAATPTPAR